LRRIRIDVGTLANVGLNDACDEGRLFEREVLDPLSEIQLRGRLDAVGAVPEVDLVAVQRENFRLRIAFLNLEGNQRFLDFAFPRALEADGGGEQIARQLLGQRRTAGDIAPAGDVAHQREEHPRHRQAVVLEKPGVLSGQDRLP
jgi:hypothetical protein